MTEEKKAEYLRKIERVFDVCERSVEDLEVALAKLANDLEDALGESHRLHTLRLENETEIAELKIDRETFRNQRDKLIDQLVAYSETITNLKLKLADEAQQSESLQKFVDKCENIACGTMEGGSWEESADALLRYVVDSMKPLFCSACGGTGRHDMGCSK